MKGKYKNHFQFFLVLVYRSFIRLIIRSLISWDKNNQPVQNGCTVIIAMCSKLPGVLYGNLLGLRLAQWSSLNEVIIAVDNVENEISKLFEEQIINDFKDLNIRFIHYSKYQSFVTDLLKIPYVYSWLSWAIAINACRTSSFFIHDYDALFLGDFLKDRYINFVNSKRIMQGVLYYQTNGLLTDDKLVCTFEAFTDTQWARSYPPVAMFNKLGFINERSVDYDTLLFMQQYYTKEADRGIIPMSEEELLHPTQMIFQYTVFQKFPKRPWHCAALVMIPFFLSLKDQSILKDVVNRIKLSSNKVIELLGDGCLMNFSTLSSENLDKMLRLMIQGYIKFNIKPFQDFYNYGTALYDLIDLPISERWRIFQTKEQENWLKILKASFV